MVMLHIRDEERNIEFTQIPYEDNTIDIKILLSGIIDGFLHRQSALYAKIEALEEEIKDYKEAFELSDDSLSNLRQTVSSIKGEQNGTK